MKSQLKFITCGSVDDGKSTLIGHMLYDAKLLFADQAQALQLDSRVGSAGGSIDYSLLLDGLMAEREQGITIDVAYRYFTTQRRSFIVADTPGHEEYTRNMAVGASFADVAVVLLDVTKGVLQQTRRHTRICSMMGIRDFVFTVNKMDLVDYEQEVFDGICQKIRSFTEEYPIHSLEIIPVSATCGDNINAPSENLAWYSGSALLPYLEQIEPYHAPDGGSFRMAVQRVCRPDHTFRGFQGQVDRGQVSVGDVLTVLPSGETAGVKAIYCADRSADTAVKGQPVTLQLDREVDVSRGCVLAAGQLPLVGRSFYASILWMDDARLLEGQSYYLKLGTRMVPATVNKIYYKRDVNTGEHVPAEALFKNEIAYCLISADSRLVLDDFLRDRRMGELILINRLTNMTSACGTVTRLAEGFGNLVRQELDITRKIRARQMGQQPLTLWFTGLSGSGKSTLANELEKRLVHMGKHTMLLDGDNVRMGLNQDLSFQKKDRIENIRRIAEVAKLMNDAGLIVLSSFISPFRSDRKNARHIIGDSFVEIYVDTPLEECERRDAKGLYQQARAGQISNFTGISSPYEIPEAPEITVSTVGHTVEESVDQLLDTLEPYLQLQEG